MKTIEWKLSAVFFLERKKNQHSYEGDGLNDRVAIVYNLMSEKIKKYMKLRIKVIFWEFRFKINLLDQIL